MARVKVTVLSDASAPSLVLALLPAFAVAVGIAAEDERRLGTVVERLVSFTLDNAYPDDDRRMPPNDRVGLAEIAAMLGVTKNTALRYARREDFPAPVEHLASGRVWRHRDVERWGKARLQLPTGRPGRPPPPPTK